MTEEIKQLLFHQAGVDLDSLGSVALSRATADRMLSHGISEPAAYVQLLRTSKDELHHLVEELAVCETWFFRDRGPFEFLELFARNRQGLRVLSAPCSTGEEAYSIAMTLLGAGLPADRFHVDACDLSRRALDVAARAVYRASSFREDWRNLRERWFHPVSDGFALRPEVTALGHFHRDDLLNPVFLSVQPLYDVVFCRNLLIYLQPEAQRALIQRLGTLVRQDGIVVTGHAEVALLLRYSYEAVSYRHCFACYKKMPLNHPTPAPQGARESAALAVPRRRIVAVRPGTPPGADRDTLLRQARRFADGASYENALSVCRDLLAREPDAEAYYLQGVISMARDRLASAEESFRKALYLNPAHYESLIQMSLLYDRRGEPAQARLFRVRAASLANGQKETLNAR